ncbi:MAG: hypothetical protein QM714_02790 [Nocardioides sp.]|uniref:hypothetical protein n=1 Tax=Nocardioides sp. TaxID=35761 RepID=UPI0039E3A68F
MTAPTLAERLNEHQWTTWRSFTNDNTIRRCCGQDFGNATRKGRRGDAEAAAAALNEHLASVALAWMRERLAEVEAPGYLGHGSPGRFWYQVALAEVAEALGGES